jgi:hypothetical protein
VTEGALIDFGEPLAMLLAAVLHFISDDDYPSRPSLSTEPEY